MKLLLDTHAALWLISEYEKLSDKAKELIKDNSNTKFISIASCWEIAIKVSTGKLTLQDGGVAAFIDKIENSPIEILPITTQHIKIVESLPFIHRDPFDRVLIATAISESMNILTDDDNIQKYDVLFTW